MSTSKTINYSKKSQIPVVNKNTEKTSLAKNNMRKETEFQKTNGMSNKSKSPQSLSNSQPYGLNQSEPKNTKNQNKLGSIQRLYIPPNNKNDKEKQLDKQVLGDDYFKKDNEAQKNRLNEEHSQYINEASKLEINKKPDFASKIKDLKSSKIEDIQVKKAILNNVNAKMNLEALFPPDVSDEQLEEMLTSESFIACKVENSHSLFDLINFLRIYLRKIEKNYSVDDLYSFLKTNITSGYRNFTVELLEKYTRGKYTSSLGVYSDIPNETQIQVFKAKNRSWSQLNKQTNSTYAQSFKQQNNKVANKPIQKLIENISLFKVIFHIIQRDLLVKIFLPSENYDVNKNGMVSLTKKRSDRSLSELSRLVESTENPQQQQQKQTILKKLERYHGILHELNEKLMLLINDHKRCDIKLLSPHSALQAKFLYYKHGEFVLRLTTDIISKFQMILNICQTVYYLNFKLKENDLTVNYYDQSEEGDYDREFNYYTCSREESKKQQAVLKILPRKKMQAFQRLPKIMNDNLNNSNGKFVYSNIFKAKKEHMLNGKSKTTVMKEKSSSETIDMLGQSLKTTKLKNLNAIISNHKRKTKEAESVQQERELIIEVLKRRLDSSDSIIRETDSDSIASDTDSLFFCLNSDSLEYEEQSKYPIEVFINPKNKNLLI